MSEDNIYNTPLTHSEIQLLVAGYHKGETGIALRAYMARTGASINEAKGVVNGCLSAFDSGETVISTGTTSKK